MESTWLLASCHKEEATVRVLEENMAREVKAAELLGKEPRSEVRRDLSFDIVTPHRSRWAPKTAEVKKVEWFCQSSAGPILWWEVGLLSSEPCYQANGDGAGQKQQRHPGRKILWIQIKRGPFFLGSRMEPQKNTEYPEGSSLLP